MGTVLGLNEPMLAYRQAGSGYIGIEEGGQLLNEVTIVEKCSIRQSGPLLIIERLSRYMLRQKSDCNGA